MTQTLNATGQIQLLDSGYAKEARSLLYQAYRNEPMYRYVFEAEREGYERRVRVTMRELVKQHFLQDFPALGLLVNDRLVGVTLIAPPQRRLGVTESWAWQLRMVLGTGLNCTRTYLEYHDAVMACVPGDAVHMLPLIGIHPEFLGQQYGEQLLKAVHDWCSEDEHSEGVIIDTGNLQHVGFLKQLGYLEIGEAAVGPVREQVLFHAKPRASSPEIE